MWYKLVKSHHRLSKCDIRVRPILREAGVGAKVESPHKVATSHIRCMYRFSALP